MTDAQRLTVIMSHRRIVRGSDDMSNKYLWMCVEADKYELPLYVADSARELAEKFGTTKHNVETFVCKQSNGRINGFKYIKVLNDGQDM